MAIVGVVLAFVMWPAGLALSLVARRRVRRSGARGDDLATIGIAVAATEGLLCLVVLGWVWYAVERTAQLVEKPFDTFDETTERILETDCGHAGTPPCDRAVASGPRADELWGRFEERADRGHDAFQRRADRSQEAFDESSRRMMDSFEESSRRMQESFEEDSRRMHDWFDRESARMDGAGDDPGQ